MAEMGPEITTFVGNEIQLINAIQCGADHLILEDSKVSIRSYTHDFNIFHFEKLALLALKARQLNPDLILSVNCDLLMHHRHENTLHELILILKKSKLDRIRIQDPGLIEFFKLYYPEAQLELAYEIGNQNVKSMSFYQDYTVRQLLSNDISKDNISVISKTLNTELEIQVQGPILIQYSNRRFLTGLEKHKHPDTPTTIQRIAQDEQYLGRNFNFYDTPHGHFMYLYFDRCLLKMINELSSLQLKSWLIDGRGESDDYLTTCLRLYKFARNSFYKEGHFKASPSDLSQLEQVATRPQRPGFFKINKTDQIRYKKHIDIHIELIGTVLDSIKGGIVTIELESKLKVGEFVLLKTPKGLEKEILITSLHSIDGQPTKEALPLCLVQIPWQKHLAPKVKLYRTKRN